MRAFAFALAASLVPAAAWACSYPGPTPFEIEANPADVTPPSPPTLTLRAIKRDTTHDEGCGGGAVDSCADIAYVLVDVAAQDDVSAQVGYRIDAPRLSEHGRVIAPRDGKLQLFLVDDDGEDLRFTLEIAAVDQAGNVSEPRTVEVKHERDGCQLGAGHSGALLLALTLAMRRALCRRTRGAGASRP